MGCCCASESATLSRAYKSDEWPDIKPPTVACQRTVAALLEEARRGQFFLCSAAITGEPMSASLLFKQIARQRLNCLGDICEPQLVPFLVHSHVWDLFEVALWAHEFFAELDSAIGVEAMSEKASGKLEQLLAKRHSSLSVECASQMLALWHSEPFFVWLRLNFPQYFAVLDYWFAESNRLPLAETTPLSKAQRSDALLHIHTEANGFGQICVQSDDDEGFYISLFHLKPLSLGISEAKSQKLSKNILDSIGGFLFTFDPSLFDCQWTLAVQRNFDGLITDVVIDEKNAFKAQLEMYASLRLAMSYDLFVVFYSGYREFKEKTRNTPLSVCLEEAVELDTSAPIIECQLAVQRTVNAVRRPRYFHWVDLREADVSNPNVTSNAFQRFFTDEFWTFCV